MTIQRNAGNNFHIHAAFAEHLNDMLTGERSRFSENITRLEGHT